MGRFVDLDKPLSQEDREYLQSRGRGYLLYANERRFGTPDNPREPEEHEKAGAPSQSPFYDTQARDRAVYDVGGASLPGTTLDYDTGRTFDRENGVIVEPSPVNQPGAYANHIREPEGFDSSSEEDDDIDEDIVEEVLKLHVAGLKGRLTTLGVDVDPDDKKADLQNKLAIALQDERDGK